MKGHRMNWPLFVAALMFWLLETKFFGWNPRPLSLAELVCDGIVLLTLAISLNWSFVNVTIHVNRTEDQE